jgi:hypothetical protein
MLTKSKSITVIVLTVCAALGVGYLVGEKDWSQPAITRVVNQSRKERDAAKLGDKSWEKWQDLVESNFKQRKDIVKGLIEIAQDRRRAGEERILAVVLLERSASDGAADFCTRNIGLRIAKTHVRMDDDAQRQQPCFYALKQMGWQVIPHVLEFVEGKRSPQEIQMVGQLLEDICGPKVAAVILEDQMKKLVGDPSKAQAITNIKQILGDMSPVKDPSK